MKKHLLSLFSLAVVFNYATSQTLPLYQNTTDVGQQYNPGLSNNTPTLVFDDVNIDPSLIAGSDSVAITNVKFGLNRGANAPAVTIKFYYSPSIPNKTNPSQQISVPPVQIGSIDLPVNSGGATDQLVSIGDGVTPIFKVKTNIGSVYTNYETFFLGMSFSVGGPSTTQWKFSTPTQSYNNDHFWLYDPNANQAFAASYNGNPYSTFDLQVSGYGVVNILPVIFSNFKGERNGTVNNLSWTTASEQNNKGFEVQRSQDGNTFNTISFVQSKAANGHSAANLAYQFTDETPLTGPVYYRLKQMDLDGKATMSPVVLIKESSANTFVISGIYPNPVHKVANLSVNTAVAQKVTLLITDLAGHVVMQQTTTTVAGNNNFSLNVGKLSSGTYLIKVVGANGSKSSVSKVVKE